MAQSSATILIVDDNDDLRELAVVIVEDLGYRVLAARGGEEALAIIRGGAPVELLLTDIVMPGLNGRELGEALAGHRPALPVLYMSGYTNDVLERGLLPHGAPFVQKPFTPGALVDRVGELLRGAAAAP